MELREPIELINKKLLEEYGTDHGRNPKFRVVFSEDQFEKRWTSFTKDGFELINPVVETLPKYKQWIHAKYVLERLIPITGETDLVDKISYEPAWVFQDKAGNYLPPFFEGCKFIIEAMFNAVYGRRVEVKYKDDASKEQYLAHIQKVEEELFGNETEISDHLAYGTGVIVPGNTIH